MGQEVEHSSGNVQTTATTPSSASGGPKVSMFVKKSGFVIPKNKLSGSLVPIFRGTKRGDGDLVNDDTSNQVQRKTKWGPDLTLDTTTRRGRASAYQIRINQISQQLTLRALELEGNEDLQAARDHQFSKEELELLELEKREIIGELLKLNPTFKAPADYKPLLKEAKVPIPIKEHPGYEYIGLVFGPASDTLKRLEKETGAKIQVYGSKTDTGVKVEFTPTDGKDVENAYKDLYLHISADTFEKVDAAVALIELLVTPVSVNPASASTATAVPSDATNPTHLSQSTSSSIIPPPVINQGMAQAFSIPVPSPQGQYPQFPQSWFPAGPTQPPPYPQAGLISPAGSTPSLASSSVHGSSVPYNPSNMPSLLGVRPIVATNFSQVMQNYSAAPSPAQLPLAKQPLYAQQAPSQGQTGAPRNANGPILQPPHGQASLPAPPHNVRPVISAPALPTNESSRWLPPPMGPSASQGPTHIMQMTPPLPSLGQNFVSGVPPASYPNMISPLSGGSKSAGPAAGQQPHGGFSSVFPSAASESTLSAIQPSQIGPQQHAMPQAPIRAPPPNTVPGPAPRPFAVQSSVSHHQPGIPNSFSGNAPSFDAINSSMAAPRPQQSSSGDFTFQPHRPPPIPANQVWPSNQPPQHSLRPPVQAGHGPLGPQPLFRPLLHNPPAQGFARPQASHQGNQSRAQIPPTFSGPPPIPMIPPRHHALPGSNAVASAMQPRNFVPPHPINNSPGPFMPGPGNHIQESQLPGAARPQRFPPPHQHFGNYPVGTFARPVGGPQQVYDPFSPTAAPFNPQMGGGNTSRPHSENDPEYEDLMASVGVK